MSYAIKSGDTVGTTITASDTLVYTATTGRTSIVFAGTVVNTSSNSEHNVSLKIHRNIGGGDQWILLDVPILYGGTLLLPKMVLNSQDTIYMKGDTSGVFTANFSVVELY